MNKIIKRLEIIKSAIELEDEEIIRQQLIYLKNEPQDAVISAIAQAIEARRFSDAMQEIAACNRNSQYAGGAGSTGGTGTSVRVVHHSSTHCRMAQAPPDESRHKEGKWVRG